MSEATVLVVEDEEAYIDALQVGLTREGFKVEVARTGLEALRMIGSVAPDVVLLDIMLPGISGLDVCREIRRTSNVPIVMITAKSTELDIVLALELGADDYVTKPYRLRELVARIRVVLRRRVAPSAAEVPATDAAEKVYDLNGVRIEMDRFAVIVDGEQVAIPPKEFDLLLLLISYAGRVLTREVIIDRVWGHDYFGDTKTLDVHIKRLRKKIERNPDEPERIITHRGRGYMFTTSATPGTRPDDGELIDQ
jgi:two-component system, OmpR family, response regulator RegX3